MKSPLFSRLSRAAGLLGCLLLAGTALAQAPDRPVDAATRKEVIDLVLKTLSENYRAPDQLPALEKLIRANEAKGAYDKITSGIEFGARITADLQSITHDKHMRLEVAYDKPTAGAAASQVAAESRAEQERRQNYGLRQVSVLDGNIGYIKLNAFADPERGGGTISAAMVAIAYTDALILDMRDNRGGGRMAHVLASYFFTGPPVLLSSVKYPRRDEGLQFWSLPTLEGPRYVNKPVIILTGERTNSAAESFSYFMRRLKRARLVGAVTNGAANPNLHFPIHPLFSFSVPIGTTVTDTPEENWEGKGLTPDVLTPTADAQKVAYKMLLEELLAKADDASRRSELQALLMGLR